MHVLKMILILTGLVYFTTIIWDLTVILSHKRNPDMNTFWNEYGFDHRDKGDIFLLSVYFSFTTVASIGLGDIVPHSDAERLLCAMVMLFGVALFSYIQNTFMKMVNHLMTFNMEYEQDRQLQQFHSAIKKYNHGQYLDKDHM